MAFKRDDGGGLDLLSFALGLANGGGSPTGEGAYIEGNTLWIPPSFVESFDDGELILKAEYAELVNGILSVKGSTEPTIDEDVQYIGIKNHTPQLVKDVRIGVLAYLTTTNKTSIVAAINEVNAELDGKADADDVYPKSETYSDDEVDSKLNAKANVADVYAKTETYTKTEVDDKISSELANYIGLFNSVSELPHTTDIQNNDYANVLSDGIYKRYKYNSSTDTWTEEFTINNSPFTTAQWDALNSGIDDDKVGDYDEHIADMDNPHSVTKAQVGLGNVDNTSDMAKPVSTAQAEAINAKYTKPDTGIPLTDLASSVVALLNSISGKYEKPNGGIPQADLSSAVQALLTLAGTALQSISSTDVTDALGYTPYDGATNPNGYTSNTGTVTGITMNGASKGASGVVDLGTVLTALPTNINADTVDGYHIVIANAPPTDADEHTIAIVVPTA